MKKRTIALMAGLMAAGMLAGCSGGGESGAPEAEQG